MTGAGWHKAGPDQQLPPHVAWNQVSDAERRSLDGSASAENISRGQQRGAARSNSFKLPQGVLLPKSRLLTTYRSIFLVSTAALKCRSVHLRCTACQTVKLYKCTPSLLTALHTLFGLYIASGAPDIGCAAVQLLDQTLSRLAYLQQRLI